MQLGPLDRTPPPFFRQGPSAFAQLTLFAALAIFLMAADTRFAISGPMRSTLATALLPIQRALLEPVRLANDLGAYLGGLHSARTELDAAEARLAAQAIPASRLAALEAENTRLRALLELRPRQPVQAAAAEVLFEASDPFSRRIVIDRGSARGVVLSSPVLSEAGVLGQVTRVYPFTSEVTLLGDKDAAIPVLNQRTQQRGAAFGGAATAIDGASMELRYLASNADVKVGDLLTTGGLDGIYAPGLPVAQVVAVDRLSEGGFARIRLAPVARADGVRHVLVASPIANVRPRRGTGTTEAETGPQPAAGHRP